MTETLSNASVSLSLTQVQVFEQLPSHARLPESAHVLGDITHRLLTVWHRGEERPNTIDHAHWHN